MALHSGYPPLHSKLGQSPEHSATVIVDFTSGIPQNSTRTVFSFDHDYGYIPASLSSIKMTGLAGGSSVYGIGSAGLGATLVVKAYCTASQFLITVFDNFNWISNATELQVSYYIFAEDGT
jgi:hypothetical protein